MTTQQGFPDWQRYLQNAGDVLLNAVDAVNAGKNYGPFYVGNAQTVVLQCHPSQAADFFTVDLHWYNDQALAVGIADPQVAVDDQGTCYRAFPVLGNWLYVNVNRFAGANGGNFTTKVFTLSSRFVTAELVGQAARTFGAADVLGAAGGAVTRQLTTPINGYATAAARSSVNGVRVEVQQMYLAATWYPVLVQENTTGPVVQCQGPVLSAPTRLVVTNLNAGAAVVDSSFGVGP